MGRAWKAVSPSLSYAASSAGWVNQRSAGRAARSERGRAAATSGATAVGETAGVVEVTEERGAGGVDGRAGPGVAYSQS
jgi:hypothetical protein